MNRVTAFICGAIIAAALSSVSCSNDKAPDIAIPPVPATPTYTAPSSVTLTPPEAAAVLPTITQPAAPAHTAGNTVRLAPLVRVNDDAERAAYIKAYANAARANQLLGEARFIVVGKYGGLRLKP